MRLKKILTTTTFAKRVSLLKRVTRMISRKIIAPIYECSSSCHTPVTDNASIPSIYHIAQRETFGKFGISHSTRENSSRCRLKTNATKTLMRYRAGLSASQVNEDRFKPEDKRGRCVATNFNKYLRVPLFRERRYRDSIGKHGANRADKLDRSAIPEYNIFIGRYRSQIAKFSTRPIWITYSNLLGRLTREYERSLID